MLFDGEKGLRRAALSFRRFFGVVHYSIIQGEPVHVGSFPTGKFGPTDLFLVRPPFFGPTDRSYT
jgi:hypothetical protein